MIYKFQSGGVTVPPFAVYQPLQFPGALPASGNGFGFDATGASSASGTKGTSDSTKGQVTEKDLLSMIEKGLEGILPSDAKAITSELTTLLSSVGNSTFGVGSNPFAAQTSSIAGKYISALTKLNNCKFSAKQYEKARDLVESNKGINEVAIDSRGKLVCMNEKGDFKLLSPEQLKESEGYTPLTNAELLDYRAQTGAFSDKITNVVLQGIGIESVTKMITDVVSKLGSTKLSEEGYSKTESGNITEGIEFLKKAAAAANDNGITSNLTVDGLYQSGFMRKDLAAQAKLALLYIYSVMPENAKSLLKVKSMLNGGDGTSKDAQNLIAIMINSSLSSEFDFSTHNTNKGGKDNAGSDAMGAEEKTKLNVAAQWMMGAGVTETFTLNQGTSEAVRVTGNGMPITKNGDPLGPTTLDKVSSSDFGGALNWQMASMGGVRINYQLQNRITVDGSSIHKVRLPVDKTERARGIIVPDQNYLKKCEQVRRRLQDKHIDDSNPEHLKKYRDVINQEYQKENMPLLVGSDGKINVTDYVEFGVINGMASSQALNDRIPDYAEEVTNKNIISSFDAMIKQNDSSYKRDSGFLWGGDELYKGTIYIPVNSNYANAGMEMTASQFMANERLQQLSDKAKQARQNTINGAEAFNIK